MISHVYRRLHRNKLTTTIIAGGGGGTWGYRFKELQPLTNRERARLFWFPDDFVFVGTIAQIRKQIGNAAPPVGARAVSKELIKLFRNSYKNIEIANLKPLSGDVLNYVKLEIDNHQLPLLKKLQ